MKPYPSYKPSGVQWLGALPSGWAIGALKREFLIVNGSTPSSGEPSYWDGNLVWVTPSDLGRLVGNGLHDTERKLTEEGLANCGARMVSANSLVISIRAPIGHVAIGKVPFATNQGCRALVPVRHSDVRYMYYLLVLGKEELQTRGQGTTFLELSSSALSDFKVCLPPADEQQAIADYLDIETARIDTLINEKDELIGLLREWRQSVIAEYTSGATQPQGKRATGNVHMPLIPSDWSMVRLGKYARIGNGSTPLKDNASYWEGGTFPWLNSAVVNRDTVNEGSEYVTDVALRACHLPIVEPGALLVALTGQGKTRGQVTVLCIKATINQHLAYLALDETHFDTNFLFWTLTGMYAALRMVSDGQGGTKGALTCDDLARFEVPKPPLTVQQHIASAISRQTANIDDLIAHTYDEIALLKELRSATIADAVLGRIDVRTAPRQ